MKPLRRLRSAALALRRDAVEVDLAARDARTPLAARLLAAAVAAHALNPIDLIPDVIPVLGLLDELVLVPLGAALVVRLVPAAVTADARADRPVSRGCRRRRRVAGPRRWGRARLLTTRSTRWDRVRNTLYAPFYDPVVRRLDDGRRRSLALTSSRASGS